MEALGRVSKSSLERPYLRLLNRSHSYCRFTKLDSARVWEGFLLRQDSASHAIKGFLTGYVINSLQLRIVLDARERAKVRTVRNASTVVVVWRALIAAADFHIMEPKRRAQPKKARILTLQWLHNVEGRLTGPGFDIVLVSNAFFLDGRVNAD
jgi:hypothetical protein